MREWQTDYIEGIVICHMGGGRARAREPSMWKLCSVYLKMRSRGAGMFVKVVTGLR